MKYTVYFYFLKKKELKTRFIKLTGNILCFQQFTKPKACKAFLVFVLNSGVVHLQKLKNPGFSRDVLPFFPGLFQGS